MVKAVVDTNVFISGLLLKKSLPRKIFLLLKEKKFELSISPLIFAEILRTLNKPKIRKLVSLEDCKELIVFLESVATFVFPKEKISLCRDPEDNIILECASAGKVDKIVTGDTDLLSLKSFRGISIVTPKEFLKLF